MILQNFPSWKNKELAMKTISKNVQGYLFDMDGVILRHPTLHKRVARNASRYVGKRFGLMNVEEMNAMNQQLYKLHGHTAAGISNLIEEPWHVTLKDFNNFVYDERMFQSLEKSSIHPDTSDAALQARQTFSSIKSSGSLCGVFSNAPYEWCERALYALGIERNLIDTIITPDEGMSNFLKPSTASYCMARRSFAEMAGWNLHEAKNATLVFVDDQLDNIIPLTDDDNTEADNWIPVLFDSTRKGIVKSRRMYIVSKLDDLLHALQH